MRVDLYIIGEPHIMSERWELFTKLIKANGPDGTVVEIDSHLPPDAIIEVIDDELCIWDDEDFWFQTAEPTFILRLSHPAMIRELQEAL